MAEDAKVAVVEIASAALTNQETLSCNEDDEVIETKKCESEVDQNDSRSTNTDGAQSPASSTYADCEETDLPNSTNADDNLSKETTLVTNENAEIVISDCENDANSSPVVTKNCDDDEEQPVCVNKPEKVPNGNFDREHRVEHDGDYIDLDSEEYEIEGVSVDEFGSHDSEEDRENGDGEEENQDDLAQKKLDDDEDRRNPQYIPKRGFFYEHDDRTADTGSENEAEGGSVKETPGEPEPESKRKGRRNIPDGRWQHDMYKEDEQKAKSTQELINVYGYDIRNEESAPKARRRRKYGRGPNRYMRKWDDEDAYARQTGGKTAFRASRRQKPLPVQREEYDAEFPSLDRKARSRPGASRERRKSPAAAPPPSQKPVRNHEFARYDGGETRYREERRRTPPPPRKTNNNSDYVVDRSSRSFTKRIPTVTQVAPVKIHVAGLDANEDIKPMRTKLLVNNSITIGPRGRGMMGHGKPLIRHVSNTNEYGEPLPRSASSEPRMQFLPSNRGRAKRLDRPSPNQGFFAGKSVNDDEMHELTDQMAAADLRTHRNAPIKNDIVERRPTSNELIQEQPARSKRYSYQRQRLLPDSSNEKNVMDAATTTPAAAVTLHSLSNMQSEHASVTNMIQPNDNSGLHQQMVPRTSVPMRPEGQLTTVPPPPNTASLSMSSSNSLAVSASLIPLSAPPMTASGAATLQTAAPPLPIMGFFQHPQGFTNQGTAAQIYTRPDQNIMAAPSNQPVHVVAFLPATPMLSTTNHTGPGAAPAAPPPPPPPPTYSTSVMNYPQASPTPQAQPSFSSETYSMPPVTLAPIHQPEMYQSRGGVTYYNTRSQVKPRSPPPPRVKTAIPIVPPPNEN